MKAYKLFFEPDKAVPQFKLLRFEEVEVPLRDVLTRGCHPVPPARPRRALTSRAAEPPGGHWRGSPGRDTSHAAEAVVNRLNEDDARVAALKDFGYSHDLHTTSPPSRYAYGGSWQYREPSLADELRALGKEVYFVRDLAFKELFKIAWERLKAGWNGGVARSMLTKRFYEFNELRRFLKSKDASITLHKRDEVEALDLGGVLGPEDFKDQEKLVIEHGIPGGLCFRRESALAGLTTEDGVLSLVSAMDHMGLWADGVTWNCERRGGSVRAIPELPRGETGLREKARKLAGRFGESRYCFTAPIDEVEKLLAEDWKEGAKVSFPTLNYLEEGKEAPESSASVVDDVKVPRFVVPATLTDARTNKELREALAFHHEKVSGTKAEMLARIAGVCVKLYGKHKRRLKKLFRDRYVRLNPYSTVDGRCFDTDLEPRYGGTGAADTPLKGTVISMFVMKHLRADRILDPAYENTAYTEDDLARALLARQVTVQGTFVRAS